MSTLAPVAVLCVLPRSRYFQLAAEVYDQARDAFNYAGTLPVVAHPPCRQFSRLRGLAYHVPRERDLAHFCVARVRELGGVLEHPSFSKLWQDAALPPPGRYQRDEFGGFTIDVDQAWWGHPARKRSWFYVCGVSPRDIPPVPLSFALATRTVSNFAPKYTSRLPELAKRGRNATPPALADWLIELALRCGAARSRSAA